MAKQQYIGELEIITCCSCGMVFGMPDDFVRRRREDGESFYCPSGHKQSYSEPELKKLKKALEAADRKAAQYQGWYQAEQDDHEHTRKRLAATKGVVTRTKNRIANGVCPCCNRHFANLERHMHGQHPDYLANQD